MAERVSRQKVASLAAAGGLLGGPGSNAATTLRSGTQRVEVTDPGQVYPASQSWTELVPK